MLGSVTGRGAAFVRREGRVDQESYEAAMCHVLIIEDNLIAALDIREVLREAGATSFAYAGSEDEAVAAAKVDPPDLITADVSLAGGSGPEAVRRIEARLGSRPVIFITGAPDRRLVRERHLVIGKPFATNRLSAAFRSIAPV